MRAATCLPLLAAACALTAPSAESVLPAPAGGDPASQPGTRGDAVLPLEARAARLQTLCDQQAATLLQRHRAVPADLEGALAATAALFAAADLRLQRATCAWLAAHPQAGLAAIVAADDQVGDPARMEILGLCTAGLAAAEQAVQAAKAVPERAQAELHRGLHLSLVAWANGPARSLFAGYGKRLVAAIDAAVAADATIDHGAPLRLQGRFRGKAPWPYGDLALAQTALARATTLAPITVNHLFYGDVLWASDETEAARTQWLAATTAADDTATPWSGQLLREQARRRLAALPAR